MNFKKVFVVIFIYFLNSNFLQAMEPDIFVQTTVDRASQVLSEDISKEDKINELKKIANETVDTVSYTHLTLPTKRIV